MRSILLIVACVFALAGCKSAEQRAAEVQRVIANSKKVCTEFGYAENSLENARCAESLFKQIAENEAADARSAATVAARNRVSCYSYGGYTNCY
jgi:uncharacterized protein YcfL